VALINPKADEPEYPFRDLAGCGVVAKLALALAVSDTPLYGRDVWLLHAQPGNGTCTLRVARMVNLRCVETLADTLPHGPESLRRSRVYRALAGKTALVYDLGDQQRHLGAVGGPAELELQDLQPEVEQVFPELAGQSLLRVRESERLVKPRPSEEWDVLTTLYAATAWEKHGLEQSLEPVLDLAALGTIADLMPLVDENKVIVRRGLAVMNRMGRPGLRELFIRQNLHGRRVTAKDISWQIAPVLNSAGRMGEPERAALLFLEKGAEEVERLIDYILELNRKRKQLGDKLWDSCFPQARASLERSGGKFVLVLAAEIPRGITGILAARLVGFFKVPAVVVAVGEAKAVGSLRSPYPASGFLDLFAELLQNYGGHDRAAGFNLGPERCAEFEKRFFEVVREYVPPDRGEPKLVVDAEVPPAYLNPELIKVVELFEPYGEGCPPLVFLTRGAQVESVEVMGRRELAHLRLLLRAERFRWPAVYWNAAERAGRDFNVNDRVDVVFRLNRNYFLNTETLQLTILDLNRCARD
jgi:single-stranded-DNA-specific exonuclease